VSAATAGRALETTRYVTAVCTAALGAGLPLTAAPSGELVRLDDALSAVVPAVMATMADVVAEATGQRTSDDVAWRKAILDWLAPAMRARVAGDVALPMPKRAEVVDAEVIRQGRHDQGPQWRTSVVDVEVIADEEADDDPDTDEPGDAELVAEVERLRRVVAR
jgi:hypothetical protein